MKELFASELKNNLPAGRRKLARTLIDESRYEKGSSANQFVLLAGAIECAEDANALDLCFESADAMGTAFDIDVPATKRGTALVILQKPSARLVADEVLSNCFSLVDQFIAADDWHGALQLAEEMRGPGSTDAELGNLVAEKLQEVLSLESSCQRRAAAIEKLKHAPDDAAANQAIGEYLCFGKERWATGLPLLAKGNDENLKAIAADELRGSESRARVADEWWDLGTSLSGLNQVHVWRHAAKIYLDAIPWLEGSRRKLVEERIAEAAAMDTAPSPVHEIYFFDNLTALDNFEIDGNATVTPKHELDLCRGMPSAVMTKQRFRYPIRVVFEAYCKADGAQDIFPSILAGREDDGFGLAIGTGEHRESKVNLFGKFSKLPLEPIQSDRVYRIVLSVDKGRNATIELDGKEIYRAPIPANARPEGMIVLSGGRGHVVYRRCIVTAFGPAKN